MILGIVGRKRSGKDTFASVLAEAGWARVAFADALKEELASLLGVDAAFVEGHKEQLRLALQLRGTEHWRARDPEHWLREAERRVNVLLCAGRDVVMPDVRFLNEAHWVRSHGGLLVRTVRAGDDGAVLDGHASETEQNDIACDRTLFCRSGDEVRAKAKEFLNWYKQHYSS